MRTRDVVRRGISAALLAGLMGFAVPSGAAHAVPARGVVSGYPAPDDAERQLFDWLNHERTSRGLSPLVRQQALDGFAQAWSDFMASGGCTAREGRRICHRQDLAAVAQASFPGAWLRIGENVGLVPEFGTLESLHQLFMDSVGHRANVLLVEYTALGIGVTVDATGTLFATYEFMTVRGAAAPPAAGSGGLPAPSPGLSEEDTLLFWINDARAKEGLGPLVRQSVLDREAEIWSSGLLAGSACGAGAPLCHRGDLSVVTKTAVGASGSRWWSENVGLRAPADLVGQFTGFMSSPLHRANIMRPDINIVGIGYAADAGGGKAYTTIEFVAAKQPANTLPRSGNPCGWASRTIGRGATGPFVRTLQCGLTRAGVYSGPIDGWYGPAVVDAVKAFQARHGVRRPSGKADLKTRRLLGLV